MFHYKKQSFCYKMEGTPFIKQLLVAVSPLLAALSVGGAVTYPTVLLHQLKANDTTIELDFDTSSWIGSIHGLAGIPSILIPSIMQWRGRKFAYIFACIITIIGWIIAYTATNITSILICESFHGFGGNSILAVSFLSISEMICPKNRIAYMQLYTVLQILMMAINGLLTQYVHWKTIALIMCAPMILAVAIAFSWPESPYWLAFKGEYEKCEKAFVWLRGRDEISQKELDEMIAAHKENCTTKNNMSFRKFFEKISRRDFYLPSFHTFVLQYLFYWCGNYVIIIYSIELIQQSTQNENAAFYGGLLMNMILCIGTIISIVLNRYFGKKSIMLWSVFVAGGAMLASSLVSYLQVVNVLPKNSSLCLYTLVCFMVGNGIGIVPIAYNVAIEIMPVKHRGLGGAFIVVTSCILHSSSLKISPYLFIYIDLWGTFLFYAFNCLICGVFIWKYIPETEDKSLREIEDYYNFGTSKKRNLSVLVEETAPMASEMVDMSK